MPGPTSLLRFMRRFVAPILALAVLAAPLGWPQAAWAQQSGITVERNKGTIIHLPGNANVVAVADPAIADVEVLAPDLVSVQGRGVGQTTVVAFNARGQEILNKTVTVSHNLSTLDTLVKRVMPDSTIRFDSIDGALVMSGSVASPLEADNIRRLVEPFLGDDQLVNMLDIQGSDQVMLQVRVAEVSRNELKRFGINWESILNSGNFVFGLATGRDIVDATSGSRFIRGDANALGVGLNTNSVNINTVIDALAEDNLIKVLAEPNLTTASGRTANFLAGGEFPIPVPGQDGQVTIDYRTYGVGLQFTPQVLSKDKISLTVAPEVSELSQVGAVTLQGFNVPALITRRAETTVELGSGQSFAIAGLLRNNAGNTISKFPVLGEIPILGALFRSTEFQHEQTELMILVTPYIVRGVNANELTDPTEGYVPPTDPERVLLGHSYTPKPEPKPVELYGSPADLRKPKFRRAMAEQAAGKPLADRNEVMTPAPSVAKTTPIADGATAPVAPVTVETIKPVPAPKPAPEAVPPSAPEAATTAPPSPNLNGPVGFMLR